MSEIISNNIIEYALFNFHQRCVPTVSPTIMVLAREEAIELETPPPSPTHIWQDDTLPSEAHETPGDYQVLSPQKRPRTAHSGHSKQRKRSRFQPSSPEFPASTTDDEPSGMQQPDDRDVPMDSVLNGDGKAQELPQGYHEYVESVAGDISGVYLINPSLFVVQGWNGRTLSAMVSYT